MYFELITKLGLISVTLGTSVIVTFVSACLALVVNFAIGRPINHQTFILATLVPFCVSAPFIYIQLRLADNLRISNEKLKKASEEIRVLTGMLPICASCKKIRDDNGYWNQLENYLKTHANIDFTHSICSDCATRLYPYLDSVTGKQK